MKKIKVLQVNKLYYPVIGGIEHIVQQLSEGLSDEVDTKVLVCQAKGPHTEEIINGIRVTKSSSMGIKYSMPISFSFIKDFKRLSKDADIVQLHFPFPLADLALFLSDYQGKVVVWWHSEIIKQRKLKMLYDPLLHWTLNRADRIIAATEGHVRYSPYLKLYNTKCEIIPYGIQIPATYAPPSTEQTHRPCRFLAVGRMVYYKGFEGLINAMAQTPNACLTIVGNGPMRQQLENLIATKKLTARIEIKSGLNEEQLSAEYDQCDAFILPSVEISEAFGLVQTEAMAHGRPVINTALKSGVPYVSIDKQTGLTVPPHNTEALAAAMREISHNAILRREYGDNARQRAQRCFSEEKMLKSVSELYKNLMGGSLNENCN